MGQRKKRRKENMSASQALDSTEGTQPKPPRKKQQECTSRELQEDQREGKAIRSTDRSQTSQSRENLIAPLPSTNNANSKALLKEALKESEQEKFNNRCKITQEKIKGDQEDGLGTKEMKDLEADMNKACWDCRMAFKEIARGLQHRVLEIEDQEGAEQAAIVLFQVHHQISRNQILQANEMQGRIRAQPQELRPGEGESMSAPKHRRRIRKKKNAVENKKGVYLNDAVSTVSDNKLRTDTVEKESGTVYPLPMEVHTTTEVTSEERRGEEEEAKGEDPGYPRKEEKRDRKIKEVSMAIIAID